MESVILGIIRLIPRRAGLRFFRWLGLLFARLSRERRRIAATNLDIAFGSSLSPAEKNRITTVSFQNLPALIFDFLKLPQLPPTERDRWIEIHGEEYFREALARGKGVLAVSAHFGNFLLLLCVMALKGYPMYVVTRHFKSDRLEKAYTAIFARFGVKTFPKRHEAANILKALKSGALVGYVLDQNMQRENGIFVDFFGKKACTVKGVATLAGRYGSPILPVFMVSTPDGRHHIHFEKPLIPDDPATMKQRDDELTQYYTTMIEGWITRYPEQWWWLHRRWKTRPEGDPAVYPPKRSLKRAIRRMQRRRRAA